MCFIMGGVLWIVFYMIEQQTQVGLLLLFVYDAIESGCFGAECYLHAVPSPQGALVGLVPPKQIFKPLKLKVKHYK